MNPLNKPIHNYESSRNMGSRVPGRERGQMMAIVALMLMASLGVCALVIDFGRLYFNYHELQATTDAAALAGAQALPSGTTAVSQATSYSSVPGDNNSYGNMQNVSLVSGYPKALCLTTLQNQGIGCSTTASPAIYNAIQVSQQVKVPMTFAKLFGISSYTLTATATASARGAISVPYNIAIILDQTASMASGADSCTDPYNGNKAYSNRLDCSLVGVKTLLMKTAPCSASYTGTGTGGTGNCPSSGASAVDMISVFVFPNCEYNTCSNVYGGSSQGTCSGFTHAPTYSFPYLGTSYTTYPYPATPAFSGTTADYQITPFLNDYRLYDGATTLNSSSNLTRILGPVGGTTCGGLTAPGGLGTFYAGALAAAQAALLAEQASTGRTTSKNAIILLSDGAANSTLLASTMEDGGSISGQNTTATKYPYYNSTSTKTNQCQQGVSAATQIVADWKSTNPTVIYSVAYGATTSTSDCTTDSGNITPCQAMTQIASAPSTFFSDYTASGGDSGCTSAVQAATGLANIFGQIASDFTVARLIPNGTS